MIKTSLDIKLIAYFRHYFRWLCKNKKRLFFIYGVYLIALFALILANFNYIDDNARNIFGDFDFAPWSRYTSSVVGTILSLNPSFLLALFPLTIFISILLLSLSSLIIVKLVNKNLFDYKIALLASIAVGLNPYYLENLSYKFYAVYMTLSLFATTFPFLFLNSKKLFIIISSICLFIMLTSYQASSGIYIMLVVFLSFKSVLNKDYKKALVLIACSVLSLLFALIVFKSIHNPLLTYATSDTLPLEYLFKGVIKNISTYLNYIYTDLGGGSKVLLALAFSFGVLFIIKNTLESRINKALALLLSIITLILLLILSQGLYIILIKPLFDPRAFIGFGIFLAIIALDSIYFRNKYFKIINYILIIPFAWYLISFATYYGQSLREHDNYQRFRYTLLAGDLGKILDNKDRNKDKRFNIIFGGSAGDSPTISKSKLEYPIIKRLVPVVQTGNIRTRDWGVAILEHYGIKAAGIFTNYCEVGEIKDKKLLLKNYYHSIYKYKIIYEYKNKEYTCYLVEFNNTL